MMVKMSCKLIIESFSFFWRYLYPLNIHKRRTYTSNYTYAAKHNMNKYLELFVISYLTIILSAFELKPYQFRWYLTVNRFSLNNAAKNTKQSWLISFRFEQLLDELFLFSSMNHKGTNLKDIYHCLIDL